MCILHDRFSLFGRLGSSYCWTKTDSNGPTEQLTGSDSARNELSSARFGATDPLQNSRHERSESDRRVCVGWHKFCIACKCPRSLFNPLKERFNE